MRAAAEDVHGVRHRAGCHPSHDRRRSLDGTPVLELKDGAGSAYVTIAAPAAITAPPVSQAVSLPGI